MSPIVNADTVQRIRLGRIVFPANASCEEHGTPGWICGWGEKPKGAKGGLVAVGQEGPKLEGGDIIYEQLRRVLPKLKEHARPLEEGPYADKAGSMALLMDSMGLNTDELEEVIERTIDIRPFVDTETEMHSPRRFQHGCSFAYKQDFVPPTDALSTAGEILTQERLYEDETTGASHVTIYNQMEMYLLAVSALRRKGLEAYPALAATPHPGADMGGPKEHLAPLIVLVDLAAEVPMKTFDLQRIHPPLGAIDIISDEGMIGVTYVIQAEARMKSLTVEQVTLSKEGKALEPEELDHRLDSIATSLFEAYKRWPGSRFISDALQHFLEDAGQAALAANLADLQNRMESLVRDNPILRLRPDLATSNAQVEALATAQAWVHAVERLLATKIAGLEIMPAVSAAQPVAMSQTQEAPRQPSVPKTRVEAPQAVAAEPQEMAQVISFPTPKAAAHASPLEATPVRAEPMAREAQVAGSHLSQEQRAAVLAYRHSMTAYLRMARVVPPGTPKDDVILATKIIEALGEQVPRQTGTSNPDLAWVLAEAALIRSG